MDYPVSSFTELLQAAPEPPVIVGGQAVNLWATAALETHPKLNQYAPFASKDCDVLGDNELVLKLSRVKGWKHSFPRKNQASPVVGCLTAKDDSGKELLVEVLRTVRGLTPQEERQKVPVELEQVHYATLSPISLLKAKVANFNQLDQNDRQDGKHISMLVHCVSFYIEVALSDCRKESDLIKICMAAVKVVKMKESTIAAEKLGLDLWECFPASLRNSRLPKVANFCAHQLPTNIKKTL